MTFRIYFTNPINNGPHAVDKETLIDSLKLVESLRLEGYELVTMVSHDINMIGQVGVNGVENGKLPDGSDYDWTKNDRVGAAFKSK